MRGFSKVIVAGNLTRDPEMRTTTGGSQVCGFTIAVNRNWRDQNGNPQESVSFLDCSAWGKLGETIAQYAKKGSGMLVSGRLDQRSWEDKATGQKRSRVEIVADDFVFAGGGRADSDAGRTTFGSNNSSEETVPETIPDEVDLSEIPF